MLTYPDINPIAFSLGPLKVHWYGLMYLCGFVATWVLGIYRSQKTWSPITSPHVGDAIFYGALGVVLGGRIGYILLYNLGYYLAHPMMMLAVWDGGMSFHGGLIGVTIAMWLYARKINIHPMDLLDFFAPMVPIGLFCGRIGNFINGELWGKVTTSPVGMIFPTGGPLPRYPSQLYEAATEGVLLFVILWCCTLKPRGRSFASALFLVGYGIFRFSAEFIREPDPQRGYVLWGWVTEGQLLCIPMILLGLYLFWQLKCKKTA
jgi:phosphatidylglycerol---prolipoprotein diacylglyceryl transferase